MRKLSLDEVWDYTKRMWAWIAFQKEVKENEQSVEKLKGMWLIQNAPEFIHMASRCFFCEACKGSSCDTGCPGSLVGGRFCCCDPAHNYQDKPGAFYREILRLDKIRTAKLVVPAHVWKHGDVFRNNVDVIMVYIQTILGDAEHVFCVSGNCAGHSNADYVHAQLENATFLFNIKNALSD